MTIEEPDRFWYPYPPPTGLFLCMYLAPSIGCVHKIVRVGAFGLRPLYCPWPRFFVHPLERGLRFSPWLRASIARDLRRCDHDYPRWGGHAMDGLHNFSMCSAHRLPHRVGVLPLPTGSGPSLCSGPPPLEQEMRYVRLVVVRHVAMADAPSACGIYNSSSEEGALALLTAGRAFLSFSFARP
jgi:hypothetical protein